MIINTRNMIIIINKKRRHNTNHNIQSPKNDRDKRGNIFRIGKVTEECAAGMRQARLKEWNKLLMFEAAKRISEEKALALMAEGAECIPLQWIDTDKNEHLRRPGGLKSTHCMRHDLLHAETWRKATRGRTVRQLSKKRVS